MEETQALISTVSGFSYIGIFGVALAANVLIPIPEELILLFLGYLSADGFFNIYIVGALFLVGLFVSDILLYWLARQGNRVVIRFAERFGIDMSPDNTFVKKHANMIIFISRFVVQFRFIGPILSGVVKVPWKRFLIYDFLALCIYVPIMLFVGQYFHDRIEAALSGIGVVRNIILITMGALVVIGLVLWLKKYVVQLIKRWTKSDPHVPTIAEEVEVFLEDPKE